jgi:hypothetical protein
VCVCVCVGVCVYVCVCVGVCVCVCVYKLSIPFVLGNAMCYIMNSWYITVLGLTAALSYKKLAFNGASVCIDRFVT